MKYKAELTETKLYCPLAITLEIDGYCEYCRYVDSANYVNYDDEINKRISRSLCYNDEEAERGLIAYTDSESLAQKVYSVFPSVETRDGDLYGVITIKSYGELSESELAELTEEVEGQLSDGWGEGFEQQEIRLGEDRAYISFWNADDYYLKPEQAVFPEKELTMGGLS